MRQASDLALECKSLMPTYDYKCNACDHRFELFQSMKDAPKRKCPECGKNALERLIGTGAAILFKGSGFYETDYRSESYKKAADAEKGSTGSDTKSESKADSKSELKPDAKAEAKPASKQDGKAESKPPSKSPATSTGRSGSGKTASKGAKRRASK